MRSSFFFFFSLLPICSSVDEVVTYDARFVEFLLLKMLISACNLESLHLRANIACREEELDGQEKAEKFAEHFSQINLGQSFFYSNKAVDDIGWSWSLKSGGT